MAYNMKIPSNDNLNSTKGKPSHVAKEYVDIIVSDSYYYSGHDPSIPSNSYLTTREQLCGMTPLCEDRCTSAEDEQ